MQILSKGYTNDANNPCDNPSSVQLFLEPGNMKLSFITYQRPVIVLVVDQIPMIFTECKRMRMTF